MDLLAAGMIGLACVLVGFVGLVIWVSYLVDDARKQEGDR